MQRTAQACYKSLSVSQLLIEAFHKVITGIKNELGSRQQYVV